MRQIQMKMEKMNQISIGWMMMKWQPQRPFIFSMGGDDEINNNIGTHKRPPQILTKMQKININNANHNYNLNDDGDQHRGDSLQVDDGDDYNENNFQSCIEALFWTHQFTALQSGPEMMLFSHWSLIW